MKTLKKIFPKFLLLTLVFFGGISVLQSEKALAQQTQPPRFYYDSCVDLVGPNNKGGTNCTFIEDSRLPNRNLLFDNGALTVTFIKNEALYNVPYSANGYSQPPPPSAVNLLDKDDKPVTVNNNPLGGRFSYTGQSYTSRGYQIVYFVYSNNADPDYVLLLGLKTNGDPPLILALVNKSVQVDPRGDNRGTVYAYELNKLAIGSTTTGAPIAQPASSTTPEDPCEGQNSGFEWILCGALSLMNEMINKTIALIEGLLAFPTNEYLGPESGVKVAWNIFKNLASVFLVIVMLIMIFSQAISIGPFDAYTVRKLLPKLVIAVLMMQISWAMVIYFIQLANAAGIAIRDLMFAPFGGSDEMAFDALVGQLGGVAPSLTQAGLFAGAAAVILFSGITIGGAFLLAVTAIISVLIGLLVLILRQMLIILAVILVPIALVMWILPGTQRYWKLWSDNFIRLLMLFPLIMAMIAAGRIFANIAGNLPNDTSAEAGLGLLPLLIIFVGVFGPLWFLPKAFSWGGQLFSMASNAAWSGTKGARNFPGKYAMNAAKMNREQRGIDRAERLANNRGRRFDPLFAGRSNLALGRTARRNRYQDTLEKGRKASDEAAARAVLGGQYEQLDHPDKVAADILVAQGRLDDQYGTGLDGRHAATQRAALERLARYGDWDAIAAVREGGYMGEEGERVWQGFVANHIGDFHKNMPHLSPQRTDLSQVGYREFYEAKDDHFDELLRQAQGGFNRDAATGALIAAPDAPAKRAAHVDQARRALEDTQFMASQSQHAIDVWRQIAALPTLTPETQVTPTRTGAVVRLPDSAALQSNPAGAVESLRSNLMHADTSIADATRVELARQLSNPSMNPADRGVYENYLQQLKNQAGSSPQARNAYNAVISNWRAQLRSRPDSAERAEVAAGSSTADIATARTNAESAVNAEYQRLTRVGLTPI